MKSSLLSFPARSNIKRFTKNFGVRWFAGPPYGVFFAVRNDVVSVIAVMHHAQHPEAWKRRAE